MLICLKKYTQRCCRLSSPEQPAVVLSRKRTDKEGALKAGHRELAEHWAEERQRGVRGTKSLQLCPAPTHKAQL